MTQEMSLGELVEAVREGRIGYLEALRLLQGMEGVPEDYRAELEYALAYNALVEGAEPSEVLGLVGPEARERLERDLPVLGEYWVLSALSAGDVEAARRWLEAYRGWLREKARLLEALTSNYEVVRLAAEGEWGRLLETLERLAGTPAAEALDAALREYYGVGLGDLFQAALAEALAAGQVTPAEAARLAEAAERLGAEEAARAARGLAAVAAAEEAAEAGDYEAALRAVLEAGDPEYARLALQAVLARAMEGDPWRLLGDERLRGLLEEAMRAAGLSVDLSGIEALQAAVEALERLRGLASEARYEEALEYYRGLPGDVRVLVAALLGMEPGEAEEWLAGLAEAAEAARVLERLNELDPVEAYKYWMGLPAEEREAAASLLGVPAEQVTMALAVRAALEEASRLAEPTPEAIRSVLEKYLGDRAEEVYRALLEESPALAVLDAVSRGAWEEALERAIQAGDPELVRYVLVKAYEAGGAEQAARLIQEHASELEKLIGGEAIALAAMVGAAPDIAESLISALEEELAAALAERLQRVVEEYLEAIREGDWRRAEEILAGNRGLLEKVEVSGEKLLDLLLRAAALARAAHFIARAREALGALEERAERDPAGAAREAERLAAEARALRGELERLAGGEARQALEILRAAEAHAHAVAAKAYLAAGGPDKALEHAEEAARLDQAYAQLRDYVALARELARNPERIIECALRRAGAL